MRLRPFASPATNSRPSGVTSTSCFGVVDQLEQLGRLDHQDAVAEIEAQAGGQLEEVDAVAVVVHDLQQADDLVDRHAGHRLHARAAAAGAALVGQVDLGDRGVDLVDQLEEGRVAVLARMRQGVGDHLLHAARVGGHDQDAVGEEDRFLDQMGDQQQALSPCCCATTARTPPSAAPRR